METVLKCGFKDWLNCTKECRWFKTCTRNPHRKEDKKAGRVYKGSTGSSRGGE